MNPTMLPPPPFSPVTPTERRSLLQFSSPGSNSSNSNVSRNSSSRRSLSSHLLGSSDTRAGKKKSRSSSTSSTSTAVFGISLLICVVLVSIHLTTIQYYRYSAVDNNNELGGTATATLLLQKRQFLKEGATRVAALHSRSLSTSSSASSTTVEERYEDESVVAQRLQQLKEESTKQVSDLQERITQLEYKLQQVQQLRMKTHNTNKDPEEAEVSLSDESSSSKSIMNKNQKKKDTNKKQKKKKNNKNQLDLSTAALRKQQGYESPACSLQVDEDANEDNTAPVFDRIFFLHMRKAGGSSLRSYFEEVQTTHNITIDFAEGWRYPEIPPSLQRDDSIVDKRDGPRTLYVTHVREPISRVISHYKYEHRWLCEQQLKQEGFVPSANNTNIELMEFITTDYQPKPKKKLYWECSSECYAKWFTGYQPANGDSTTQGYKQELDQKARDVIFNGYHLVIVSEWLKDKSYQAGIEQLFGVQGVGRRMWMKCRVPTKQANEQVPLNITKEEMSIIETNNRVDTGIYNDLLKCGTDGTGTPQFKNRKPIKFVSSSS